MPVAHDPPPITAPSLHAALGAMRARGMRVSAARRLVLAELYGAERPLTVDELIARVPGADAASVYRNVETLEAIGLVRHVHLGHGPARYSVIAKAGDVEFLACERCGAFETVAAARLDEARDLIERELGYRARFTHFPLVGICASCRAASPRPALSDGT